MYSQSRDQSSNGLAFNRLSGSKCFCYTFLMRGKLIERGVVPRSIRNESPQLDCELVYAEETQRELPDDYHRSLANYAV